MAKMRWNKDIDWRGLNDAEYSEDEFDDYDGPLPPSNLILSGRVKKIWGTESSNGDAMLKVLFEADGNTGERKVYNGWGGWDNVLFSLPQVKFRWQPFFDAIGISLADVKNKTMTDGEDNQGDVITKIGSVKFDGKGPLARVKIKREKYEGETQAKVGKWLPPADAITDDEDDFEDGDEDGDEDDPF